MSPEPPDFWVRRREDLIDDIQVAIFHRDRVRDDVTLGLAGLTDLTAAREKLARLEEMLAELDREHPEARKLPTK